MDHEPVGIMLLWLTFQNFPNLHYNNWSYNAHDMNRSQNFLTRDKTVIT